MKNCGQRFHQELGKFRFLNELIRMISPKVGRVTQDMAIGAFTRFSLPQGMSYQGVLLVLLILYRAVHVTLRVDTRNDDNEGWFMTRKMPCFSDYTNCLFMSLFIVII